MGTRLGDDLGGFSDFSVLLGVICVRRVSTGEGGEGLEILWGEEMGSEFLGRETSVEC